MHEALAYLPQILPAYIAYLVAVASPGPAVMAIIATSMTHGRKAGMTIALGIFGGSLTWAIAAAAGLATLLQTYAMALEVLKIFGGLYLLYLAYKALRAVRISGDTPTATTEAKVPTFKSLILRGYGIHVTNPKAIFAWLAIIALGMPQGAPGSVAILIITVCGATGFVAFMGYAVLFSTPHALKIYRSARRWIEGAMAGFYCFAGIKLLTSNI
ncbi:LysE family translocator [Rhizobium rhizogenes]|uniref:LysE family translocator n=1 Tax=Rhizobium rhizogenes TaxID=359 RepID=UPI0004D96B3D|nr:LysE family translocator [Rhizobium rhizogenes]KEA04185.1 amino acid transporter [Rhizobium rhizogenes]MQB31753.1 LysE family translocator [Rhizobium rhizogenes]NTI82510.1 LysE family translocator [Rhizobium rhizogenes]NTJ24692.1 LysE family translocator [Rhizobium rhizogenes]QUE79712.1 LysE family translocator [Rhizobium rhizogenes]